MLILLLRETTQVNKKIDCRFVEISVRAYSRVEIHGRNYMVSTTLANDGKNGSTESRRRRTRRRDGRGKKPKKKTNGYRCDMIEAMTPNGKYGYFPAIC